MEDCILQLIYQIHDALHKIEGILDAKADLKPNLRFVDDDAKVISFPSPNANVGTLEDTEDGFVEFTQKEIKQMPKHFSRLIIINRKRCRIRKHPSGRGFTYEIRFRCGGYDISASGKTKELAKANMLKKMRFTPSSAETNESGVPTSFHSFAIYFFETFRKRKVSPQTYKSDLHRYTKYLAPHFGETPIDKITLVSCQELVDKIVAQSKFKTADEIYSLMNVIFAFAVDNHIIDRKPSDAVFLMPYNSESGVALTKEEETTLLNGLADEPTFQIAAAIALYTGLRPNELATAVIENDFIVSVNSKRHNNKVEYKRIPIIDRLRPFLVNGIPPLPTPQLLRRRIKDVLPNHKLYDLRTTFHTRCRECNVEENALKEFMGHSFGTLGNTYTDFSKSVAYLLKEGMKLNEW